MSINVTVSYVTAPNKDIARKLGRALVEKRLAACVNIVETIESIYEWEGKVNQDNESLMIIKSLKDKSEELSRFIQENHPYDCPEVITMPVTSGAKDYLDWVHETVNKQPIVPIEEEKS